ncbi:MAG TPA: L,D-transpeptidase family protein [Xanthobacteraceae bacterium]|nr:L,D-transpeptidase family protein [Xanthobacteraceae bacterium]
MRLRTILLATTFCLSLSSAFGQSGVTAPTEGLRKAGTPMPQAKPIKRAVASFWTSPEPTFDEGTYNRINEALLSYSAIEVRGGWPQMPKVTLEPGASGPHVSKLRQRLAVTEDLPPELADGDIYDMMLTEAVKRFQIRHGLPETGTVGPQTIEALNAPVTKRIRQLVASLDRLNGMNFVFGQRYVVVNIPAAVAEAVEDGKVARRYVTVVGKTDRPSPTLTANITAVNINPTWTVPLSILKKDIVTKMRKDPSYVSRLRMRVLDSAGNEIDPASVDWNSDRTPNFTVRQDSGDGNALGNLRIDMPNSYSVYMHDTNHKEFFSADYRFQSSGCTRVQGVQDLAAWILKDKEGWSRKEIDAEIATGKRTTVRLARPMPVAWIYLTGWASPDGTIHFRKDVYDLDPKPAVATTIDVGRPVRVSAARASGFVLQSDDAPAFRPVSYLDSR